ncbi:MAG TPA: thioredoxin [Ktedonobacteraceae bacterium]|nr:thioredoxin [Ktedonobacteraceae bacterium]
MQAHNNLFHVTDQDFESKILKSDRPVIVDFWAEWCGPCRMVAPTYEKLSDEFASKLAFAKMDVDENPRTPGGLGIQGIPTMIVFNNGKEVGRIVGAYPPPQLKNQIERLLTKAENGVA